MNFEHPGIEPNPSRTSLLAFQAVLIADPHVVFEYGEVSEVNQLLIKIQNELDKPQTIQTFEEHIALSGIKKAS